MILLACMWLEYVAVYAVGINSIHSYWSSGKCWMCLKTFFTHVFVANNTYYFGLYNRMVTTSTCSLFLSIYLQGTDPRHASPDQDQSSMLKVICNQRDRFRTRLRETEEVCFMQFWKCLRRCVSSKTGCVVLSWSICETAPMRHYITGFYFSQGLVVSEWCGLISDHLFRNVTRQSLNLKGWILIREDHFPWFSS